MTKSVQTLELVRIYRFIAVGFLNTLFGYGVFAVFILNDIHYSLSILVATILGIVFNFFTVGSIVFNSLPWQRVYRFLFVYCIAYGVNVLLLFFLNAAGLSSLISGVIAIPTVSIMTYFGLRRLVFF